MLRLPYFLDPCDRQETGEFDPSYRPLNIVHLVDESQRTEKTDPITTTLNRRPKKSPLKLHNLFESEPIRISDPRIIARNRREFGRSWAPIQEPDLLAGSSSSPPSVYSPFISSMDEPSEVEKGKLMEKCDIF
jgi:hypothetical protein